MHEKFVFGSLLRIGGSIAISYQRCGRLRCSVMLVSLKAVEVGGGTALRAIIELDAVLHAFNTLRSGGRGIVPVLLDARSTDA